MSNRSIDSRESVRLPVEADLSSRLSFQGDEVNLHGLGIDVGRTGLGIASFTNLPIDSLVIFQASRPIEMKVVWCRMDPLRERMFHIGLEATDRSVNLISELRKLNLIATRRDSPRKESVSIAYDDVIQLARTAHVANPAALRSAGFAALAGEFECYPANHQGHSVYLVLPKQVKPSEVQQMPEQTARSQVAVFRKKRAIWPDSELWSQVWPVPDNQSEKKSVLVVEDEAELRSVVVELMEKRLPGRFQYHEATDAIEGLRKVFAHRNFAMIIVDIMMPRYKGLDLLKTLRAIDNYATLPVLVITGASSREHLQSGIQLGVSGWLTKPFDTERLAKLLSSALED